MKIGIDFGGVIVKSAVGNTSIDLRSGLNLMIPGAFEGIAELVTMSSGNIWIVSKASHATQVATRDWLHQTQFYKITNFTPGNIYFCEKRHEKKEICQLLGLTHFIDDSPDVIDHITGIVPNIYQFGSAGIHSWHDLLELLRSSIRGL